jgi:hypothetical protein
MNDLSAAWGRRMGCKRREQLYRKVAMSGIESIDRRPAGLFPPLLAGAVDRYSSLAGCAGAERREVAAPNVRETMKASLFAVASIALCSSPHLELVRGTPNTWSEADPAIRAWYQSLTQPDDPTMSCCGEADAFEADIFEAEGDHYIAIITNGKGVIPNGTRIAVPNAKMKVDKGNPTGHGIIFLGVDGKIFCYVTPSGL